MINRTVLVGRLTRDPETRKTQSGTTVTRFTIAIDRPTRQGQEKQTDFISCITFGKTAEFVDQYIRKGFLVGVDGRIQTGSYEDKEGRRVYTTDIVADSVQNYQPREQSQQKQSYQKPSNEPEDDFEPTLNISSDDLPF